VIRLFGQAQVKWTDGLRRFLTADAIAASNSIEGFKVSTVGVADLIEPRRWHTST
jgi:hypothetical protein